MSDQPTQDHDHTECQRQADLRREGIGRALVDHQEGCLVEALGGQRLVSRHITVAEYVDPDGARRVQLHASDGTEAQDAIGVLTIALRALGG